MIGPPRPTDRPPPADAFFAAVAARIDAIGPPCDAAVAWATARGADAATEYALRLVVEELLSNVAKYAGARGDVELRVEADRDAFVVVVCDDGTPFDPTAAPPPADHTSLATAPVGGLGLQMVRSVARAFTYRRTAGRNEVAVTVGPPR